MCGIVGIVKFNDQEITDKELRIFTDSLHHRGPDGKNIFLSKNKKIGFSVGGFEDALLSEMLKESGLTLSDVELININFSLSPSLISKKVDAVIGAFRNFELNQMDIVNNPGRAF